MLICLLLSFCPKILLMKVEPVTLEGDFVRLEPLSSAHAETLFEIGSDPDIWRWTTSVIENLADMKIYVAEALEMQKRGEAVPFVTIDKDSGEIVGSTRFGHIDVSNKRVEIGWTWINPKWQRTYINTEAKLLMLTHAFESWKCVRVEIITDVLNERSRTAILRLGAKEEGVLRQHMVLKTGRLRDTVVHSIIDSEWSEIKKNLTNKLRSF